MSDSVCNIRDQKKPNDMQYDRSARSGIKVIQTKSMLIHPPCQQGSMCELVRKVHLQRLLLHRASPCP